ncbi:flagellar hook-length control protein FliK [Paraburkholderia sp. Cy-641]|uniref:flagellar hook-length control protein FliK n=1 Tax=Paraburkholderia sp. Cy-641 TaxID=2608337 RepID=UPI00141E1258|nr:flagellar hook-length control protein FliK [Paraburkholderia sp. Cy-641]NIF81750.1 flagellar hook-length control protein FliK [Paraburkholderia sp. Cy-641]
MNGIDTAVASVLSSRIDSLLNIAPGAATTSQTGAAGVAGAPIAATPNVTPAPQPSAQTALSAVALTLNAIANSGGEATPAVLGQAPIWPAAPALDIAVEGLPGADAASSAGSADAATANSNAAASANGTVATASIAATQVPVAALAAALERTVSDSGLFYEAHLAGWLVGQRSPENLADEAQNRLVAAAQLPPGWADEDGDAGATGFASEAMASGMQRGMPGTATSGVQSGSQQGSQPGPQAGSPAGSPNPSADAPTHAMPSILTAQAARFAAGEVLASSLSDLTGQPAHAGLHSAAPQIGDAAASQNAQSTAAAVHPATEPLVRQQLDLLATGQFRWTGEAWPGARLDWTIEQDGDEWDRSGGGLASEDDQPWRTRLTLSLPTLGTVDAELTLTGMRLTARVQASPHGAARLAIQGESFRERLAAAGIELQGLTIREIGGGVPGAPGAASATGTAGAQAAASAYARSATAGTASSTMPATATPGGVAANPAGYGSAAARGTPGARDDFDWDI